MLTYQQRIYSADLKELMILFDIYADSDRHAALLLNKSLSRTREDGDYISSKRICELVTKSGIKANREIKEVLKAYNVLYGFDGIALIPGVTLDTSITNPEVPATVTRDKIVKAVSAANRFKLDNNDAQADYVAAFKTVDRNPEETAYIFLDDVGTPRQRDTRKSPNHDGVPRKSKKVPTTNGVILVKEGIYYLNGDDTPEMLMMIRGFLLKNHLLEDRDLVCFSDGAKDIWKNYGKIFSFRPRVLNADWYHLKHKSNELFTRFLNGSKKYEDEIKEFKKEYFHILWTGNMEKAIYHLHEIDPKLLKPGRDVSLLVEYLKSKREHHTIPVFAARKQLVQVNASSLSETANCTMTTSRQKKQGKSWSTDGSHGRTTWRNLFTNDEAYRVFHNRKLHLKPVKNSKAHYKNKLGDNLADSIKTPVSDDPEMSEGE